MARPPRSDDFRTRDAAMIPPLVDAGQPVRCTPAAGVTRSVVTERLNPLRWLGGESPTPRPLQHAEPPERALLRARWDGPHLRLRRDAVRHDPPRARAHLRLL